MHFNAFIAFKHLCGELVLYSPLTNRKTRQTHISESDYSYLFSGYFHKKRTGAQEKTKHFDHTGQK